MQPHIPFRRMLPALLPALCAPGALIAGTAETESDDYWWESEPSPRAMISLSSVHADENAGPNTDGLRVGFGILYGKEDDYAWGELWAAYRENGQYDVTSAGVSAVPFWLRHRRLGVGLLLDIGVSYRRDDDRSAFAGMIGAGVEGAVRLCRRWDFVAAAESVYRTTSEIDRQLRFGIRYHHEKLVKWGD